MVSECSVSVTVFFSIVPALGMISHSSPPLCVFYARLFQLYFRHAHIVCRMDNVELFCRVCV